MPAWTFIPLSHYLAAMGVFVEACWSLECSGKQVEKGSLTQDLVLELKRTYKCHTCESEQDFNKVTEADRKDAYWKKHPFPIGSKCYCGIDWDQSGTIKNGRQWKTQPSQHSGTARVRPQMTFNSKSFFLLLLECLWFLWDSCEVKTHIGRQEDVLGHLGAYLSTVITNMKKDQ